MSRKKYNHSGRSVSLICPVCHGEREVNYENNTVYCPYCGDKFIIDYEKGKQDYEEIRKNAEKEHQRRIEEEQRLEVQQKEQKLKDKQKKRIINLVCLCVVAVIIVVAMFLNNKLWGVLSAIISIIIIIISILIIAKFEKIETGEKNKTAKGIVDFLLFLLSLLILYLIYILIFRYLLGEPKLSENNEHNKVTITRSAKEFCDKKYETVEKYFKQLGFKNIKIQPIKDIKIGSSDYRKVKNIKINGSHFSKGDNIDKRNTVVIEYHDYYKDIAVTCNSDYFHGLNYKDVIEQLKSMGFTDVTTEKIDDVILGIFVEEGEVEDVSIDGKTKYNDGDFFRDTSHVIISYHVR